MTIKPFFARFLEVQTPVTTNSKPGKAPEMHTMKYPSDNDSFNPNDRGYAVKLRREALPEPLYAAKLRREAVDLSQESLKEANCKTPEKPRNVVTLAYPSDSDVMEGRPRFY